MRDKRGVAFVKPESGDQETILSVIGQLKDPIGLLVSLRRFHPSLYLLLVTPHGPSGTL